MRGSRKKCKTWTASRCDGNLKPIEWSVVADIFYRTCWWGISPLGSVKRLHGSPIARSLNFEDRSKRARQISRRPRWGIIPTGSVLFLAGQDLMQPLSEPIAEADSNVQATSSWTRDILGWRDTSTVSCMSPVVFWDCF